MYFPSVQLKWDHTAVESLLTGKAHSANGSDGEIWTGVHNFIIDCWFSLNMAAQKEQSPVQDFQEKSTAEWTSLQNHHQGKKYKDFFHSSCFQIANIEVNWWFVFEGKDGHISRTVIWACLNYHELFILQFLSLVPYTSLKKLHRQGMMKWQ